MVDNNNIKVENVMINNVIEDYNYLKENKL